MYSEIEAETKDFLADYAKLDASFEHLKISGLNINVNFKEIVRRVSLQEWCQGPSGQWSGWFDSSKKNDQNFQIQQSVAILGTLVPSTSFRESLRPLVQKKLVRCMPERLDHWEEQALRSTSIIF